MLMLICIVHVTDIRKQEEVLQESHMMIPDSKSRLEKVIMELITIMVGYHTHMLSSLLMDVSHCYGYNPTAERRIRQ